MPGAGDTGVVRFIRGAIGANADAAPDAELLRRFAANADEQAFRALVARHGPVVWAVCRRMLGNLHDSEDAFQATFLVFARGAAGIRTGNAVAGWLCGVAGRVASRVRSARRPVVAETEVATGHPDGVLGDLTGREAEGLLYEELARLPEKYRAALVLCCLEGFSHDEAARQLGWTANQLKNSLEQGRGRLRLQLARRGIALGVPPLTTILAPATASAVPPALSDTIVQHATGAPAPAAISSLAHGVTRTMWIANWKWLIAGCAALALTGGGILAAVLVQSPAPPAPVVKSEPVIDPAQPPRVPAQPAKIQKPPLNVATEFLSAALNDKTEEALARCVPGTVSKNKIAELAKGGLIEVNFVAILMNDTRAEAITKKHIVNARGTEPVEGHTILMLVCKPEGPWQVKDIDFRDAARVKERFALYLEGKYDHPPAKP